MSKRTKLKANYYPHSPWRQDIFGQWHWCKPPNYTEVQSKLREAKFKLGRTES